ncbi:von Willebrand factor A domain-containing protein 5A-like isoform X2 [Polypterus senegalus]|uniref:von Willebrand factor A domain-containing protein 5A-like isoform X2 n=1 Tax=Polypterus senegalus TaxID=55291 RepID=UPI001964C1AB|nr:von Willebrand factor A domain-containing protein 5A-like isoform X2 [Polypterus senegalus]
MVKRRIPFAGFMQGGGVMMACAMPRRTMSPPCPPQPTVIFQSYCNSNIGDLQYPFVKTSFTPVHIKSVEKKKERTDPLLNLVSLQNADGSWNLEKGLMTLFSKTEKEVLQKMPVEIKDKSVWATFLALLWLHGFNSHQKDEWEFVALKAVFWIKAQTSLNPKLCLQAGNDLLGCQVDLQTLAL